MRKKSFWITLALVNLCIVAFLGFILRSKFLFPIPFLDYKSFLSAHSHFAFGGWVTVILILLLVEILPQNRKQKNIYQYLLWGIALSSYGMLLSFPFGGYTLISIIFSTLFILVTYIFSWVFIVDMRKSVRSGPVFLLAVSAVLYLVISSIGPFTLAYILATNSGDAILFRDAIYTFLHFQYNGFFTLAVFAIFFNHKMQNADANMKKRMQQFAVVISLSVVPSLFLSMLWHPYNVYIQWLAYVGLGLLILTFFSFLSLVIAMRDQFLYKLPLARLLLIFAMIAFGLKTVFQTGTIIPSLAHAVFGFRPVIIGFLHLVFLGLVTLFILSHLIETNLFSVGRKLSRRSILFFLFAIIFNEAVLFSDGLGLLLGFTHYIYGWLLWVASILLFTGALCIVVARMQATGAGRREPVTV